MADRDAGHEGNADFAVEEEPERQGRGASEPEDAGPSGLADHRPGTGLGVEKPDEAEAEGQGLQVWPPRKDPGEVPKGSFADRVRREREGS